MTCIYTILSPTNKIYVGQTTNFARRSKVYKWSNCPGQTKLYNSLQKHGWSAHKCRPVIYLSDNASPETLTYWEQFVMDFYKSKGYTLLNIRQAGVRGRLSQETKEKIGKANQGKKHSLDTRKRISLSRRGKKLSASHRINIGKGVLGNSHLPETRVKISEAQRGERGNNFRGFILVYRDGEFIGRYAGCNEAAVRWGVSKTSILRAIKRQQSPKTGPLRDYIFIRET